MAHSESSANPLVQLLAMAFHLGKAKVARPACNKAGKFPYSFFHTQGIAPTGEFLYLGFYPY
jgi:hypothetical protein